MPDWIACVCDWKVMFVGCVCVRACVRACMCGWVRGVVRVEVYVPVWVLVFGRFRICVRIWKGWGLVCVCVYVEE